MDEFEVSPWNVSGKIDYDKLIERFGTQKLENSLLEELKNLTGDLHLFLRRNVFFSHRDFDKILNDLKNGKGFYLYTGRGPSGPMHLGHLLPFIISKWFQEKFGLNVYIEITDDEKFLHSENLDLNDTYRFSMENALDIISLGFDEDRTFIFLDSEYIRNMYKLSLRVAKKVNYSTVKAVFGFKDSTNIGMLFYPTLQIVPTFFENRRCLIPEAIDQDPYWRIQRDIAESLGYYKASVIHSKFLPPLTGIEGKMSSSMPETAIYLNDSPDIVKRKIMKYAFSGGQATVEEHRKLGGNTDVDVAFQWLYMMFEEDDRRIKDLEQGYRKGEILTGEMKSILIEKINGFLVDFRNRREKYRDRLDRFMYDGKLAEKMWETFYDR
ncbi:MAG: tryptophan--tRNA ligase [Thermoplasmata archaeon]